MGKYGDILDDFYSERTRILDALHRPENKHIVLRLIGALAFRTHCPEFGYIQDALGRVFTDIDFATYPKFHKDVIRFLTDLGYKEDQTVTQLFGETRLFFHDLAFGRHIDIFFNGLDFCHNVSFVGRLEADDLTLPLAELLLEKLQIFHINEKDLIDVIMLLREHPVGENDREMINSNVITNILCNDWGFWRTATQNLDLVSDMLDHYSRLEDEDRKVVRERIGNIRQSIEGQPKTLRWKMRAKVGERVKWYKDVEELIDR